MTLRIFIQMDPMEGVQVRGDTTFALAREALSRGHEVWTYGAERLRLEGGRVTALAHRIERLTETQGSHVVFDTTEVRDLGEADVVLVRQDPPFDMTYITTCHILEMLPPEVLVLNDPAEIRNAPEKIFVMAFPDLMPPTLITSDESAIREFRDRHGEIVVKPLYGNGGAGVFRLRREDENLASLLEMFLGAPGPCRRPVPVIAQGYLPAVRQGDKRVLLVDGEPIGAINRVPAEGEARSNMHVGGRAEAAELTERDREICTRLAPELKRRRLVLTGIDVIGGLITEINVTSPTGVQELKRFGGPDVSAAFWDWTETAAARR
ncbi:glutathione synthase [Parvularcula dongshanensis]|uniref:Glutathione synthetase n=1 Tax=Parvularcula dongshanensis TaxID=1173995 RepID=A0A840I0F9_9PROT|nr:glutathione synthase [Parvularcula dongshanensis]MBB4657771.1 glutathione synthase [Parvularcula dongshanensis]